MPPQFDSSMSSNPSANGAVFAVRRKGLSFRGCVLWSIICLGGQFGGPKLFMGQLGL